MDLTACDLCVHCQRTQINHVPRVNVKPAHSKVKGPSTSCHYTMYRIHTDNTGTCPTMLSIAYFEICRHVTTRASARVLLVSQARHVGIQVCAFGIMGLVIICLIYIIHVHQMVVVIPCVVMELYRERKNVTVEFQRFFAGHTITKLTFIA